jgi:hypothetical protein
MRKLMSFLALGAVAALVGVVSTPSAHAQSQAEQSTFVVTDPLYVGNVTLQPGTYRIKVVLIDSNRDMLQVTDPDQQKVFATVLSRPHQILPGEAMPESRYVLWTLTPGQPRALKTWYARDRESGHDIVYPKERALELAAATRESVIAIPDTVKEAELRTAPLLVVTPDRTVKPYEPAVVQAAPKPAPPVLVAEARPPKELSRTASPVPLLAVLGLLSLGGAVGLRALAHRAA